MNIFKILMLLILPVYVQASQKISLDINPTKDSIIWESGIVEDAHKAADEYSDDYKGIGICILVGDQGVETALALGEKIQDIYKNKYDVESRYFVRVAENSGDDNMSVIYFVDGVPSATARSMESVKGLAIASMNVHKNKSQVKHDDYDEDVSKGLKPKKH